MGIDFRYFKKLDDKGIGYTPAVEISLCDAKKWNGVGYGIFFCPNSFKGENRKKCNVDRINMYFVDMDDSSKEEQVVLINKGLKPSWIVESKRGYHLYWYVKDGSVTTWDTIMPSIIDFYGADRACKNYVMLLRYPGCYHLKNTSEPFLIKTVSNTGVVYSEKDLKYFYYKQPEKKVFKRYDVEGNDFFEKLRNANQMDLLSRIPSIYTGESITFVDHRDGTFQIKCNDKITGCWIDKHGKIGSYDKACPTVWQWLKWYGLNNKQIFEIIKEVAPELCKN